MLKMYSFSIFNTSSNLNFQTVHEEATLRTDLFSENDVANKVRKMMFTHFKYDSSRDPLYYLPEKYREEFSLEFEVQKKAALQLLERIFVLVRLLNLT